MAVALRGDQGTLTFTSGNVSLTSLDIDYWEVDENRPASSYRPFQWPLPRRVLSGKDARGRFRTYVMDGTTPPIVGDQTSTTGTIVLGHKSTTQKTTFKVLITRAHRSANSSDGSVQVVTYEFEACADSNSDDIAAAT